MAQEAAAAPERGALPPVAEVSLASLSLIVIGGIYLAAHIPQPVTLVPALALLAGACVLLGVDALLMLRMRQFAWTRFRQVGGWALLAYGISAGMLEYVFIVDHVPGLELRILTLMLLVYAVDIPLILAFSVARYRPPDP